MKICVTGGCGYIGSHLVSRLVLLGHSVVVVDNMSNGSHIHHVAKHLTHDIRKINELEKELRGIEVFFHLAANKQATSNNNNEMISVNVGGTMAVLETAKRVGATRLVFSSSAAVYPATASQLNFDGKIREQDASGGASPENIYGLSKLMGENLCHFIADENFSVVSLRYFNVWGGNYSKSNKIKSAIETFRECKDSNLPAKIYGNGLSVRDYVHVTDVVEANLIAMKQDKALPSVWNVCTEKATSILDVVEKECGKNYPIEFLPPRKNEIEYSVGSGDVAKTKMNWTATIHYGFDLD